MKSMALDPLEWITIAVIGIVIFIWGPNKIPEIARSIGSARKAFGDASKELQAMSSELKNPLNLLPQATEEPRASVILPSAPATPAAVPGTPSPDYEKRAPDRILIDKARGLGISTEGKTQEQISEEVLAKSKGPA